MNHAASPKDTHEPLLSMHFYYRLNPRAIIQKFVILSIILGVYRTSRQSE